MSGMEPPYTLCLTNGTIFSAAGVIDSGCIVIRDGRIVALGVSGEVTAPAGAEIIDVGGLRVVPGLIDLHVHGMNGQDVADGDLDTVSRALSQHGVTGFLATLTAAPHEILVKQIEALATWAERYEWQPSPIGARMLGIYLEGPFLNPDVCGVLDRQSFRLPSESEASELLNAGRGRVRLVVVAPELPGAIELISWLKSRGVICSLGHSRASYAEVVRAIPYGLRHATHVFNAMGSFHHREPGAIGAVLDRPELLAEVIVDGLHVHPAVVRLLLRMKGVDGVCVVSDAAPLTGLPAGSHNWLGRVVFTDGQMARLADGTLAGSVTSLNLELGKLIEMTGLPFDFALRTVTATPANALGLDQGRLAVGKPADIAVLDARFEARLIVVGGRVVHQAL